MYQKGMCAKHPRSTPYRISQFNLNPNPKVRVHGRVPPNLLEGHPLHETAALRRRNSTA